MDPPSSPEQVVKRRYSRRAKKKQERANNEVNDDNPESDTAEANDGAESVADENAEEEEKDEVVNVAKSSKTSGPKKVDIFLPGPSPKRNSRNDGASSAKKPESRTKPRSHSRASSIASSAANTKPPSAVGNTAASSQLTKRTQTPDSTADDQSVADEAHKPATRARKSEAERIQFLENDPLSGEVEPHRVFCIRCNDWVNLHPKRKYVMKEWVAHRKECGKQSNASSKRIDQSEVGDDEEEAEERASVAPSPREGTRVATAKRKLRLVNDAQVKSFTPHTVQCATCGDTVALGELEYDFTNWDQHKSTCSISPPIRRSLPARNKLPTFSQPPSSTVSTEATAVGSEVSPSGQKRAREDEEEERPKRAVRARTESYTRPEGDAPGLIDWFLLPFKTFVRGFREGLSSSSS